MTLTDYIKNAWAGDTLLALQAFIKIPAKSTAFDPQWKAHGYLLDALEQAKAWGQKHFPEAEFSIHEMDNLTPVLYVDIPATSQESTRPVFFYGHFDKQPETPYPEWDPWNPVVKDGQLFGRGSVDDGYSFYTTLTAVKALDQAGIERPRVTGLFETNEESGGDDIVSYIKAFKEKIGNPSFLGIIDLGANDFNHVWLTQSLRGAMSLTLKVKVLNRAVHSGMASGLIPDSFRILRLLLNHIEDPETGRIILPELHGDIPDVYLQEMKKQANNIKDLIAPYQWCDAMEPSTQDPLEAIKRNTWEPTLTVVGAQGLPSLENASALIRSETDLRLSLRLAPNASCEKAFKALEKVLTTNVPYQAHVEISHVEWAEGFMAPILSGSVKNAIESAAQSSFNTSVESIFCGATIGALHHFQEVFPESYFLNTGALAATSNAHAPFEHLSLTYVEKLTLFLANVIANLGKKA